MVHDTVFLFILQERYMCSYLFDMFSDLYGMV
jgi:hypothetical protein